MVLFVSKIAKRPEKIEKPLLRLALDIEGKILSRRQKEVSRLDRFHPENIRLWTDCAEVIRSSDLPLSTENLFVRFPSSSDITRRGFHSFH